MGYCGRWETGGGQEQEHVSLLFSVGYGASNVERVPSYPGCTTRILYTTVFNARA